MGPVSVTYTKLFSSITESTVWMESSDVRIVWVTMLAMKDRRGRVWASVPGLANRARVSLEACEEALRKFLAPDPYSRTKDFEGRRIEEIDGGWRLLNWKKFRDLEDDEIVREQTRERVQRHREKKREGNAVTPGNAGLRHADVDTEADERPTPAGAPARGTERAAPPAPVGRSAAQPENLAGTVAQEMTRLAGRRP